MTVRSGRVDVEGLSDFRRSLREVDRELPKELRAALRRDVADPVAGQVQTRVPVKSGAWRKAIRGGATQSAAYIQWGRAKVPYAGWLEFGGKRRGGRNSVAYRNRVSTGRYVWPTVRSNEDRAAEATLQAMDRTMRRARAFMD